MLMIWAFHLRFPLPPHPPPIWGTFNLSYELGLEQATPICRFPLEPIWHFLHLFGVINKIPRCIERRRESGGGAKNGSDLKFRQRKSFIGTL